MRQRETLIASLDVVSSWFLPSVEQQMQTLALSLSCYYLLSELKACAYHGHTKQMLSL